MSEEKTQKSFQFRIIVESHDGGELRYEEPYTGSVEEGLRRAWIMWARSSYVVKSNKAHNRDVYARLEVWDGETYVWRVVKDKRGRLPIDAPAPAAN